MLKRTPLLALLVALLAPPCAAQNPTAPPAASPPAGPRQTQADDFTSYELLAPESHRFRILYDVTATTSGARFYFNTIRKGSVATDERVVDLATGQPLEWDVVSGAQARAEGHPDAALDTDYIKVRLARPVPENGEQRIRIDKTYLDAQSYAPDDDGLVFRRSLGIKRNRIVLPAGYELVASNMPSQIFTMDDGRIALSFMNTNPDAVSLVLRATRLAGGEKGATRPDRTGSRGAGASPDSTDPPSRRAGAFPGSADPSSRRAGASAPAAANPILAASASVHIGERAVQDREIVYFLQPPETHAFDLFHDYTESRPGTDRYLNIVRAGSRVSNPAAHVLDTGEALEVETLRGEAITKTGIDIGEPVTDGSEVVVVRFPAVKAGTSVRLRISETYTDPDRYGLVGETLVWRRSFGRPRNTMVLPAGWYVTAVSVPATVVREPDGRVRLDFHNARPDTLDVLVRANRRSP
ncbi:MAG: hypothetical protein KJ066_00570 [Acidobacteria bacterium]|nr:hypothetical protein [Acidobacteriota bacterium]